MFGVGSCQPPTCFLNTAEQWNVNDRVPEIETSATLDACYY